MEIALQDLLPGKDYVVQIRARDRNGYSSPWSQAYELTTDIYSSPPSKPSPPVVSSSTLCAQVSHLMTKDAGGTLESHVTHFEIHANTISSFTPNALTMMGTLEVSTVLAPASGVYYYPMNTVVTNLYWKVIAVDGAGNKSTPSNSATATPGLIMDANIANATITSAKIQSLEAQKITAGTGIINNIEIKSLLTMSDGGTMESENYVPGVSGWQIASDGDAEFNEVDLRGSLRTTSADGKSYVEVRPSAPAPYTDKAGIVIAADNVNAPPTADPASIVGEDYGTTVALRLSTGVDPVTSEKSWLQLYDDEVQIGVTASGGTASSTTFFYANKIVVDHYIYYDQTWTVLTLQNSWVADGGAGNAAPAAKIMADGTVMLRGAAISGTTTNGITIATLATAFRPAHNKRFVVPRYNNMLESRYVLIQTDGQIRVWNAGTSAAFALDGIRYDIV